VTPNKDFYVVAYAAADHAVDMAQWRFELGGAVERPLRLTLEELKALPAVTEMRTLECISNPVGGNLIGNAVWQGVAMVSLLEMAGVQDGGVELKVNADDGYRTAIPLALARHPHAFLAYAMNGEPLPVEHGFPLRCLWPGRYGMKQPKWVTTMEVIREGYRGYWEKQGWSNAAPILVNSQIRRPEQGATVARDEVVVAGTAMAGETGVRRVEVSTDDGVTWRESELVQALEPVRPFVWTEWRTRWRPTTAGTAVLVVRATDGAGTMQTERTFKLVGGTFPDGANGIHSIPVTVGGQ
jgi:DMSO/TMAO reductase YedYZ molybdopterin-dependent catalytic subunit